MYVFVADVVFKVLGREMFELVVHCARCVHVPISIYLPFQCESELDFAIIFPDKLYTRRNVCANPSADEQIPSVIFCLCWRLACLLIHSIYVVTRYSMFVP